MKNLLIFLCLTLLLCNGCKYFKKSSPVLIDTISADTVSTDEVFDSAAYYSSTSNAVDVPTQSGNRVNATSGRYYMIVGCFTVQQNADKYAEKLRGLGYEAQIITGIGSYQMVAAKTYNNYRESIREIDKFRNDVTPNAWVYLKK